MPNFRIYNDTLSPDLWDTAMHLTPQIRTHLLQMAYDFYEKTNLPAPIVDVYLMGSGANYNWTPDSDVDVHVIVDYSKLQMPPETAAKTVKTAGAQWNAEHNVLIKGHKVEMNIQNSQEQKKYVTGIYSLVNDQWLRKPVKAPIQINKNVLKVQYEAMKKYIQNCIGSGDPEQMKAAKKYLDAYRQYGLDTYGELSYENIIYKMLRARGYIKLLKDRIVSVYDQQMTVDELGGKEVSESETKSKIERDDRHFYPRQSQAFLNQKTYRVNQGRIMFLKAEKKVSHISDKDIEEALQKAKESGEDYETQLKRAAMLLSWWTFVGLIGKDKSTFPFTSWVHLMDILKRTISNIDSNNEIETSNERKRLWGEIFGLCEIKIQEYIERQPSAFPVPDFPITPTSTSRETAINEITDRDIKQTHPSISMADDETFGTSKFDRSYWSKFNRGTFEANLSNLTLDELKALREKSRRFMMSHYGEEKQLDKDDFNKYSLEIKRRMRYINHPVNESPMMNKKGSQALAGDKPLKGSSVTDVMGNIVVIRQPSDGGIIAEGYTLVYFMDSDQAANAMAKGDIPYLMVPRGTFMGGGSPITDVWKKKFQKPGTEHILGLIEGHTDEKRIFVDMISVRPGWKRNHIAKLMIDRLKKSFKKAKVSTSTQTTDGEKLFGGLGVPKPKVTAEGVGAGIPETDRLKIKNTDGSVRRWQVRSKDAPKTPKFTGEEVIAVPEFDEPQKCNEDVKRINAPTSFNLSQPRGNLFSDQNPLEGVKPEIIRVIKMAESVLDRRSLKQDFFEAEYVQDLVQDIIAAEIPNVPVQNLTQLVIELTKYLARDFDIRDNGNRIGE